MTPPLKVLHVVAGLGHAGAGLSEAVAKLTREESRAGCAVTLVAVGRTGEPLYPAVDEAIASRVRVLLFVATRPFALRFSRPLVTALPGIVAEADIVHVHSAWTFPVWRTCGLALALRKPLVITPHGCLNPRRLRRSAWKKILAGWLFDRRYLRASSVIHATSPAEAEAVKAYVGNAAHARICVVPWGVDTPPDLFVGRRSCFNRRGPRRLLFLGRLDPIKGLDLLIGAWAQAVDKGRGLANDWSLIIAGEDEGGYREKLVEQALACGLKVAARRSEDIALDAESETHGDAQIFFTGPLYGRDKAEALAIADVVIQPTRDENFGFVVAEALSYGVPVITTRGAPWPELLGSPRGPEVGTDATAGGASRATEGRFSASELANSSGRCGWWVDVGVEPLAQALREAMSLSDEERRAMGECGRLLVAERYTWPKTVAGMDGVYRLALAADATNR